MDAKSKIERALESEAEWNEYVDSFSCHQILGHTQSAADCAIARYVAKKTGLIPMDDFVVGEGCIYAVRVLDTCFQWKTEIVLPAWAENVSKNTLKLRLETGRQRITRKMIKKLI